MRAAVLQDDAVNRIVGETSRATWYTNAGVTPPSPARRSRYRGQLDAFSGKVRGEEEAGCSNTGSYRASPAAAAIASGVRPSSRSCRCFSVNGICTSGQMGSCVQDRSGRKREELEPATADDRRRVAEQLSRMPDVAMDVLEREVTLKKPEQCDVGARPGPKRPHLALQADARRRTGRCRLDDLAQRHSEVDELAERRRQVERGAVDAELVQVGRDHVGLASGGHDRLRGLEGERPRTVADVHHDARLPGALGHLQ